MSNGTLVSHQNFRMFDHHNGNLSLRQDDKLLSTFSIINAIKGVVHRKWKCRPCTSHPDAFGEKSPLSFSEGRNFTKWRLLVARYFSMKRNPKHVSKLLVSKCLKLATSTPCF